MPIPSLAAAVALAASPIHVALVFAPGHGVPAAIQQAAIAEAAVIWSPHGVVITAAEPCAPFSEPTSWSIRPAPVIACATSQ